MNATHTLVDLGIPAGAHAAICLELMDAGCNHLIDEDGGVTLEGIRLVADPVGESMKKATARMKTAVEEFVEAWERSVGRVAR